MFARYEQRRAGRLCRKEHCCAARPEVGHAAEPKAATAKPAHSSRPLARYSCAGMP